MTVCQPSVTGLQLPGWCTDHTGIKWHWMNDRATCGLTDSNRTDQVGCVCVQAKYPWCIPRTVIDSHVLGTNLIVIPNFIFNFTTFMWLRNNKFQVKKEKTIFCPFWDGHLVLWGGHLQILRVHCFLVFLRVGFEEYMDQISWFYHHLKDHFNYLLHIRVSEYNSYIVLTSNT